MAAAPNADLLAAFQADRRRNPLNRPPIHGMAPVVVAEEMISDIHALLTAASEAMQELVLPDPAAHAGKRSRRWEVLNVPVNNVLSKFNAAAWKFVVRNAVRHAIGNVATGQPGEWGVLRYAAGFETRDYRLLQDAFEEGNETRQRLNGMPTEAVTRVKRETHIQVVVELVDVAGNDDIIYELGKPRRTDGMDSRMVDAMKAALGGERQPAASGADLELAALKAQVAILTQLMAGQTTIEQAKASLATAPVAAKPAAPAPVAPVAPVASVHDFEDDDEDDDGWEDAEALLEQDYQQATAGDASLLAKPTAPVATVEPAPLDPVTSGVATTYEGEIQRLALLGKRELNDEFKAAFDKSGRGMDTDAIKDALLARRFEVDHAMAQVGDDGQ